MEKQLFEAIVAILAKNLDVIISFLGGVLLWMAKRAIGKMDAQAEATQEDIEALEKRIVKLEKRQIAMITEHRLRHPNSTLHLEIEEPEES